MLNKVLIWVAVILLIGLDVNAQAQILKSTLRNNLSKNIEYKLSENFNLNINANSENLPDNFIALDDYDYNRFLYHSKEFRNVEAKLKFTWDAVTAKLDVNTRKQLLNDQIEWIRHRRDQDAMRFMNRGFNELQAYIEATKKRIQEIKNFEANYNLARNAETDYSKYHPLSENEYLYMMQNFSEFNLAERRLKLIWNILRARLDKQSERRLLENQREWIRYYRDQTAFKLMDKGLSRSKAYINATNMRIQELKNFALKNNIALLPDENEKLKKLNTEEYYDLFNNYEEFRKIDRELSVIYKSTMEKLDPSRKSKLLEDQKKWIQVGRDQDAFKFIKKGLKRPQAYVEATKKRVMELKKLNANYEDQDILINSSELSLAEKKLMEVWKNILNVLEEQKNTGIIDPATSNNIIEEQEKWLKSTRKQEVQKLMQSGLDKSKALLKVTHQRMQELQEIEKFLKELVEVDS